MVLFVGLSLLEIEDTSFLNASDKVKVPPALIKITLVNFSYGARKLFRNFLLVVFLKLFYHIPHDHFTEWVLEIAAVILN